MYRLKLLFLTITSALLGVSCSTSNLTLPVTEPAVVPIPSEVRNIGILNRSIPSTKEATTIDDIDKILSAEGRNLDRNGASAAIEGLTGRMRLEDGRFDQISVVDDSELQNNGGPIYPSELNSSEIDRIFMNNEFDLLVVLSYYDTDSRIEYDIVPVKVNIPVAGEIDAVEQQATITTLIKLGWRVYEPYNAMIIDEFIQGTEQVSSGRGINPMIAYNAIKGRDEGVRQSSLNMGRLYGNRFFTYRRRVSREYYAKGSESFKIAKRRAETGDWDGAAEMWASEINNRKRKIAGRAHYNMAISSEINGDLDAAIDWASKAYSDYNDKNALRYVRILRSRKLQREELESQGH